MKKSSLSIFFLFFILLNLFTVEYSFIFVDKGDIDRAKEIDPDIEWGQGYGVDCLILDNYNISIFTIYNYIKSKQPLTKHH